MDERLNLVKVNTDGVPLGWDLMLMTLASLASMSRCSLPLRGDTDLCSFQMYFCDAWASQAERDPFPLNWREGRHLYSPSFQSLATCTKVILDE